MATTPAPRVFFQPAASATGKPFGGQKLSFPLPHLPAAYAIVQDYMQLRANRKSDTQFTGLPYQDLNIQSNDSAHLSTAGDANALLETEGPGADEGAGMTKWTRTYFRVPASWDDWQMHTYTFPGYPGYIVLPSGTGTPVGRNPYTISVLSRLRYDYYVAEPNGTQRSALGGVQDSGNPVTGATPADISLVANENAITIIQKTLFKGAANPTFYGDSVVPSGGLTFGNLTYLETTPNQGYYQSMVTSAAANKWSSTVYPTAQGTDGQLVAETSRVQRYYGAIWMRITRYVLAQ